MGASQSNATPTEIIKLKDSAHLCCPYNFREETIIIFGFDHIEHFPLPFKSFLGILDRNFTCLKSDWLLRANKSSDYSGPRFSDNKLRW
jgi:hypothetical protein